MTIAGRRRADQAGNDAVRKNADRKNVGTRGENRARRAIGIVTARVGQQCNTKAVRWNVVAGMLGIPLFGVFVTDMLVFGAGNLTERLGTGRKRNEESDHQLLPTTRHVSSIGHIRQYLEDSSLGVGHSPIQTSIGASPAYSSIHVARRRS